MAKPMSAAPAAAAMPADDDEDAAGMGAGDVGDMGAEDEGSEGDVLLTVLKTPDGAYQLIQGDEEPNAAGEPEGETYDSPGALLKAILDCLNEDASTDGAPGSADDQFQSGYDENAPATPAAPVLQKY